MAARRTAAQLLLTAAAATPVLLRGPATTTTPLLRRAGILGRRAVSGPAPAFLSTGAACCFSSAVLGNRSAMMSPTHLATSGSLLATRGLASQPEPISPELRRELERIEKASVQSHNEAVSTFKEKQAAMRKEYAQREVDFANNFVKNSVIGWRVIWGSLAAGGLCLWLLLHTKTLWLRDFKIFVLFMMTEILVKIRCDLEESVRKTVRNEVEKEKKQD